MKHLFLRPSYAKGRWLSQMKKVLFLQRDALLRAQLIQGLEGSWMGVSGAVDSLPVPSGRGLSPLPHRLAGFPIPAVLSSCRERQRLSVPPQGFTWPWLLQSWQDKQETSIPVAQPHPFKGICCMLLYSSTLYNCWLWRLNHSGLRKNETANLSETPKTFSS